MENNLTVANKVEFEKVWELLGGINGALVCSWSHIHISTGVLKLRSDHTEGKSPAAFGLFITLYRN